MATKLAGILHTQAITAAGTNIDPALRDIVAGVEAGVAPDIVIPVPKQDGTPAAVVSALATGNLSIHHGGAGDKNFDILSLRLHSLQRVLTGAREKYAHQALAAAIANGAGTAIAPALVRGGVGQVPSIAIAIPKAVPGVATRQTYVATVLVAGALTFQHGEGAPVNHDVLILDVFSAFDVGVGGAPTDGTKQRRFYLTIADVGPDATISAVYEDRVDTSRRFEVLRTKVSGDSSTELFVAQISGTTALGATGDLDLVSGTGDASIAWTARKYEKLVDLRQNTAVPNGAGLVFDPGLVENGTAVMPDIVIPIPKAADTVPYVSTNLAGAVGNVTVQHNGGAPVNHDILSIRLHSIQRDI